MSKLSKGFTLIELLIVIGVLGILASGLLAAVDPFEQLKKARDANNRNASVETLDALTRYYATHAALPWNTTVPSCVSPGPGAVFDGISAVDSGSYPHNYVKLANPISKDTDAAVNLCIHDTLLSDGELKSGFFSGLSATLYLASGSPTTVIVCYSPEGKALRNDTNAVQWQFSPDKSQIIAGCPDATTGNCLACFQ